MLIVIGRLCQSIGTMRSLRKLYSRMRGRETVLTGQLVERKLTVRHGLNGQKNLCLWVDQTADDLLTQWTQCLCPTSISPSLFTALPYSSPFFQKCTVAFAVQTHLPYDGSLEDESPFYPKTVSYKKDDFIHIYQVHYSNPPDKQPNPLVVASY